MCMYSRVDVSRCVDLSRHKHNDNEYEASLFDRKTTTETNDDNNNDNNNSDNDNDNDSNNINTTCNLLGRALHSS